MELQTILSENILDLPFELIIKVVRKLHLSDLINMSFVCRKLNVSRSICSISLNIKDPGCSPVIQFYIGKITDDNII